MHSIDIIIFALIAVFLVLRLFSVLGKKNENSTLNTSYKRSNTQQNKTIKDVEVIYKAALSPEEQVKILEPNFSKNNFLKKAKSAYEFALKAYADGNTHILSELVDIETMRKLAYNITQQEEKNHKCKIVSFKHKDASIKSIELKNTLAKIAVNIETDITFYIENKSQKVIAGSKNKAHQISQSLCFVRNLGDTDPTWKIEALPKLPF